MATQSFPWNTVNTLVGDFVVPQVRTQVYQSNALLMRLDGKKKTFTGGRQIQQPIVWKIEGGGGGWFAGADVLDTTVRDTVQMAVTTPKSFYIPIAITWDDERTVQGPTQLQSLVELKSEQARQTAMHILAGDLYNDGSEAKHITGLQYIFKDFTGTAPGTLPSQTYLGITRAGRYDGSGGGTQTNNWWVHQGDNTAYVTTAGGNLDPLGTGKVTQVLGSMWAKIGLACGSLKLPTLILSNWGSWTTYHNSLVLGDRYVRPQMDDRTAQSGYQNLKFRSATWMVDEKSPRTSAKVEKIYFINEDTLRLYVHSDANFAFEPFRKPPNQMARVAFILWRGELLCIEPRCNGVFSSVDTSGVN